jgi:hypothetical protein
MGHFFILGVVRRSIPLFRMYREMRGGMERITYPF